MWEPDRAADDGTVPIAQREPYESADTRARKASHQAADKVAEYCKRLHKRGGGEEVKKKRGGGVGIT